MAPKRALKDCNITLFGRNPAWDHATQTTKVSGWLSHLSGRLVSFGDNTTHLVVAKKRWTEDPKPKIVQNALDAKAKGRDIKILTFDWLEDCFNSQSKKREAAYEWQTLEAAAQKVQTKAKEAKEGERKAAKSVSGMLSEVFHESTEKFIDPVEREKLDKQLERDREEKRKREQEEKEERIRRRREQAKIFGKGAVKARNSMLSDTYHIYADSTGFKYDVLVTKIDARHNRNERWALTVQIFESNAEPYNYATNTQFSGTNIAASSNVVSAMGTTFLTAMHAFKTEFQNRTGIDWEERISAHIKRIRSGKIDQGVGTGSPAPGSARGVPVSESAPREVPFDKMKFEYHPPGYGPKGEVTDAERARLKELGVTVVEGGSAAGKGKKVPAVVPIDEEIPRDTRRAVEEWMRGADMSTVVPPEIPTAPPATVPDDIDFDVMMAEAEAEGGYPFAKVGNDNEHGGANAVLPAQDSEGQEVGEQQAVATTQVPATEDSAIGPPNHDFDWEGLTTDVAHAADQAWIENELAQHAPGQDFSFGAAADGGGQDGFQHDSLQPEMPSFTTHADTSGEMPFAHGTQEIGETQVAERAGGELLEELTNGNASADRQLATPPAPMKKSAVGVEGDADTGSSISKGSKGGKAWGGLNLGSSILGKRKVAAVNSGDESGGKKAAKTTEAGEV